MMRNGTPFMITRNSELSQMESLRSQVQLRVSGLNLHGLAFFVEGILIGFYSWSVLVQWSNGEIALSFVLT